MWAGAGAVSTVAGGGSRGFLDGADHLAKFSWPYGIASSPDHSTLYVADSGNACLRVIELESGGPTSAPSVDGKRARLRHVVEQSETVPCSLLLNPRVTDLEPMLRRCFGGVVVKGWRQGIVQRCRLSVRRRCSDGCRPLAVATHAVLSVARRSRRAGDDPGGRSRARAGRRARGSRQVLMAVRRRGGAQRPRAVRRGLGQPLRAPGGCRHRHGHHAGRRRNRWLPRRAGGHRCVAQQRLSHTPQLRLRRR